MNIKSLNMRALNLAIVFAMATAFFACQTDGKQGDTEKKEDKEVKDSVEMEEELVDDFNMAKQVFYSLPSPIETAMLMKRAGAKYNADILNPVENASNYTTNLTMALNLGVYSADLSFASMFDQSQASIKYLSISKRLADDLDILNAISSKTIERMEGNVNNRDSLMEIISETFMNSNSFLKENDRAETAAIILVGGWVEGLYIATQITKATENNDELKTRIIDQRLSLSTLLQLLEQYKESENVKWLLEELEKIEALYEKVPVTTSKLEAITDKETGKTIIKSETQASISDELFVKLTKKVEELRSEITK